MSGRLFTLVNAEDADEVHAWGVEFTEHDSRSAVVILRENRQFSFGVHDSAEAAMCCWSMDEPLDLVWR